MKKFMRILWVVIVTIFSTQMGTLVEVYAEENVAGGGDVTNASDAEFPLYIHAINPGYKVDGISNVGEMIEIRRRDKSNAPLSLAGLAVGYTNSSGNYSVLYEFPENSWMTGENILLRLASSPWSELAAVNYTKTIAMTGGIKLLSYEKEMGGVCFMGEKKTMKVNGQDVRCKKVFNSAKPTTLTWNYEMNDFEHVAEYKPEYKEENYYEVEEEHKDETPDDAEGGMGGGDTTGEGEVLISRCKGMEFSEILTYFESSRAEQFIELHNTTDDQITLDGCKIGYKNKTYTLSGFVKGDGYFVYRPEGFNLTKNPANFNGISLIDVNETVVDEMTYANGQKRGTAYAFIGYDDKGEEIWKITYAPTPGEANNYQEFRTCGEGKVINPATGNCVKVATVTEKVCKSGYYLNILTGRCNKIPVTKTTTCKEGYYLNPETNRCRKIQENNGAEYSVEPEEYEEESSFVAVTAVMIVVGLGVIYVIFEFRKEIAKLWHKVFR